MGLNQYPKHTSSTIKYKFTSRVATKLEFQRAWYKNRTLKLEPTMTPVSFIQTLAITSAQNAQWNEERKHIQLTTLLGFKISVLQAQLQHYSYMSEEKVHTMKTQKQYVYLTLCPFSCMTFRTSLTEPSLE